MRLISLDGICLGCLKNVTPLYFSMNSSQVDPTVVFLCNGKGFFVVHDKLISLRRKALASMTLAAKLSLPIRESRSRFFILVSLVYFLSRPQFSISYRWEGVLEIQWCQVDTKESNNLRWSCCFLMSCWYSNFQKSDKRATRCSWHVCLSGAMTSISSR